MKKSITSILLEIMLYSYLMNPQVSNVLALWQAFFTLFFLMGERPKSFYSCDKRWCIDYSPPPRQHLKHPFLALLTLPSGKSFLPLRIY